MDPGRATPCVALPWPDRNAATQGVALPCGEETLRYRAPTNPAYNANNCLKYRFAGRMRMAPFQGEEVVGPGVAGSLGPLPSRAAWAYWASARLHPGYGAAAGTWQQVKCKRDRCVAPIPSSRSTDQRSVATRSAFRCAKQERALHVPCWNRKRPQAFSASSVLRICASTAAIAVMFNTRREVALVVRMCAGLATPIRIGPIATPSVNTRTRL